MVQNLTVKNLHVLCGDNHIVKGASLGIGAGETHILMGPNGSGKSTLLSAISGLPDTRITKGSIHLGRAELTMRPPEFRARKGLFLGFQSPPEISGVSIATMLRHARLGKDAAGEKNDIASFAQRLKEASAALALEQGFSSRSLNDGFSGGERKKSEILQLLILEPRFALLDEIDSGLDVDALRVCLSALQELQKKTGVGYLFVTHNPSLLAYVNPSLVHVMIDGHIVRTGGKELMKTIEQGGFEQFMNSLHSCA